MTATTLLDYWTDQTATAKENLNEKQEALSAAQRKLEEQRGKLSAAVKDMGDLVKEAAQNRADLTVAATPADVEALNLKLAENISKTRAKQNEILRVEADVDEARTDLDLASADVAFAKAQVTAATAALDAADEDKDLQKVGDKQAVRSDNIVKISGLADHPFAEGDKITVKGFPDKDEHEDDKFNGTFTIEKVDANSISYSQTGGKAESGGGVVFGLRALRLRHKMLKLPLESLEAQINAAKERVKRDIDPALFDCVDARHDVLMKSLDHDRKRIETLSLHSVATSEVDKRRHLFDSAAAAFRDYVVNAKRRLDQAQALAARVADPMQDPVTKAESAAIKGFPKTDGEETALQATRRGAAKARRDLANAQAERDVKRADVDIKKIQVDPKRRDINIKQIDSDITKEKAAIAARYYNIAKSRFEAKNPGEKADDDLGVKATKSVMDGATENQQIVDDDLTKAKAELKTLEDEENALKGEDGLKKAEDELSTKQGEFKEDMQNALAEWQMAVPDSAWQNLADYFAAKRLLAALNFSEEAWLDEGEILLRAMDLAEAELVGALAAAEKIERDLRDTKDKALRTAAAKWQFDAGNLQRRVFGLRYDDKSDWS